MLPETREAAPRVRSPQDALAFAAGLINGNGGGAPYRLVADRTYTSVPSGIVHHVFTARLSGLPVFAGTVQVHADADGNVLAVSAYPDLLTPGPWHETAVWIPAERALWSAAAAAGRDDLMGPSMAAATVAAAAAIAESAVSIEDPVGAMTGEITVERVAFPRPGGPVPAYVVMIDRRDSPARLVVVVSAADGEVLLTRDLTKDAGGCVFPHGHPLMTDPACAAVSPGSDQMAEQFEPAWVAGPTGSLYTEGNNAAVADSTGHEARADTGDMFCFPFTDGAGQGEPGRDIDAALTNVFWVVNTIHDRLDRLGFDEASGNFQRVNSSGAGKGGDAVRVMVQDPDTFNNARMYSLPVDGYPPVMRFGLFPGRDSAFDNDLIVHEYTHGMTDRLTGDFCLTGPEGEALAEGWSDLFALSFNGDPVFSEYARNDCEKGYRRSSYDPAVYPYTYGDICDPSCRPHSDGEIWAACLWEAERRVAEATGNEDQAACTVESAVIEGMRLTPCGPNMLDARDALTDAVASIAPEHGCRFSDAFARFGLGVSAASDGGSLPTSRIEAFDLPAECASCTAPPTPNLVLSAAGDNTVGIEWPGVPGGAQVEIRKGTGGCGSPCGPALVGRFGVFGGSSALDTDVSGGTTYAYAARAFTGPMCSSAWTCKTITPTGACTHTPTYDREPGVLRITPASQENCALMIVWNQAGSNCGGSAGSIRYNVYRSQNAEFVPDASTRIATVDGNKLWTVDEQDLSTFTLYFYIVRAEDLAAKGDGPSGGAEEKNLARESGMTRGPAGAIEDFLSDFDLVMPAGWEPVPPGAAQPSCFTLQPAGVGGSMAYHVENAEAASFDAYFGECRLITPPFDPTETTVLSFEHSYETEELFDGAVIEISPDGESWTDLGDNIMAGGYDDTSQTLYFLTNPPNTAGRLWTGFNASAGAFTDVRVDLSPYAAFVNARIRFRFLYDLQTVVGRGWTIDNVTFENAQGYYPCCAAGKCVAPELTIDSTAPSCAGQDVVFTASAPFAGCGDFKFAIDFGDGSPPEPVGDLSLPIIHRYTAVGTWTATLSAWAFPPSPGCESQAAAPVLIDIAEPPQGEVGNSLVLSKAGGADVRFSWAEVPPRYYNVHETSDPTKLPATPAGIGSQPVAAHPSQTEEAVLTLPDTDPIRFFQVRPRDLCTGETVFP